MRSLEEVLQLKRELDSMFGNPKAKTYDAILTQMGLTVPQITGGTKEINFQKRELIEMSLRQELIRLKQFKPGDEVTYSAEPGRIECILPTGEVVFKSNRGLVQKVSPFHL